MFTTAKTREIAKDIQAALDAVGKKHGFAVPPVDLRRVLAVVNISNPFQGSQMATQTEIILARALADSNAWMERYGNDGYTNSAHCKFCFGRWHATAKNSGKPIKIRHDVTIRDRSECPVTIANNILKGL